MKSSGKYNRRRREEGVNVFCIVDRNHERSAVVVDYFRNFKVIYSTVVTKSKMEECLFREEEIIVQN